MSDQVGDEVARILPKLRIDELLDEVQLRLASVRSSGDRMRQLLEAVVGLGSGLGLEAALTRIVGAAATLVDAQYGALGVLGGEQKLARFITVGMTAEQIAAIGPYPEGHGLLGELIRRPVPLRSEELSAHPHSFGFPHDHPPMHSFLGVPIRVHDEVYGNLYMTEKQGGAPFDADDEAVLTALAAAAGVVIDNARLYDEARRRQEWLETTSELTRSLLSGSDVDEVLAQFALRVRGFARADLALVALPEAEREDLLVIAADGAAADRVRGAVISADDALLGSVFKSGEPRRIANLDDGSAGADDARDGLGDGLSNGSDSSSGKSSGEGRDLLAGAGLGPVLVVPLGSASGLVRGVLVLGRRAGSEPFEAGVAQPTADLVVQAAVVLELAERRRDSELLSLYADRDRIGRDLHDLAIQRLFATSMSLQGTYKITRKPVVARRIAQAIADLDDTVKVIRSTIFALHAHELGEEDSPGMRAQVIEACEQATAVLGFPPAVRFAGPVDTLIGEPMADQVLAVLGEALSNAARHARATRVDVDLSADVERVTLKVADDGIGIPVGGRRSGLANLGERAAQVGGTFTAEPGGSAAGPGGSGGTVLTWTVPTGPPKSDAADNDADADAESGADAAAELVTEP